MILMPMEYKVSQRPNNKERCYIMSFWTSFFDACMRESGTPLERGLEHVERLLTESGESPLRYGGRNGTHGGIA